jgi:leader peptidase (prepilin peptidase)/N-methyltransferase
MKTTCQLNRCASPKPCAASPGRNDAPSGGPPIGLCAALDGAGHPLQTAPEDGWSWSMDSHVDLMSGTVSRIAAVLVAPFIGSFLGVLILRLPEGRPVAIGRSACDHCGRRLRPRDLVPFLSYLLSRGRCRYCGESIGLFPVAVEAAAAGVAGWAATATTGGLDVWLACLLGWTLLTAAWIDLRTMILPDVLTLPLLLAGLVVTAAISPDALADHALAAALGYLVLFGTARAYRRLRGRDGLGLGDAKLLAALGAWLGLNSLPIVLVLASCTGLGAAGAAMLLGKRVNAATAIPFGPCLALAGWVAWLYADWFDALLSNDPVIMNFGVS